MSGTSDQARGAASVEDTLKDFWATRPRRPRQGRKIAGVAAGIGARYGIDPVIIRVAFAVATFYGGAGIIAYLLGWLFLAEVDDEVSPAESAVGKGRSATSTPFTLALAIGVLISGGVMIDHDMSGWLGVLVLAGLLFLLHRGRGHLGTVPTPPPADPAAGPTTTMHGHFGMGKLASHVQSLATNMGHCGQPAGQQTTPMADARATAQAGTDPYGYPTEPPAWDPLGAAPFAWDLPDPNPSTPDPEPPAPRRRSKVGPLALAVSFLFVGVAVLGGAQGWGWFTPQHIIGVVLAVLGFGMVYGAFAGGGRGLSWLAIMLSIAGVGMTVVWPQGFTLTNIGDLNAAPTSLEQVAPSYQRNIGSVVVDLRDLPSSGVVRTEALVNVGDVNVIVPPTADVTLRCTAHLGDVNCLDEHQSGANRSMTVVDYGTDGPGGLKIDLEARADGAGSVEVSRG
ncbi:PspC domain-containing protein [Actinokineospora enzanensis]|uniref:PspC domain-containing protein n=1 Tax=Actinokineospora enzanensis TaxID=155975 RepID=UPI00037B8D71|nr:PspC domain-containing protein [Actinokineospora enzanensis]